VSVDKGVDRPGCGDGSCRAVHGWLHWVLDRRLCHWEGRRQWCWTCWVKLILIRRHRCDVCPLMPCVWFSSLRTVVWLQVFSYVVPQWWCLPAELGWIQVRQKHLVISCLSAATVGTCCLQSLSVVLTIPESSRRRSTSFFSQCNIVVLYTAVVKIDCVVQ